ncbi:HAMP domain-containing protein [Bacillus sp. FJAT-45037]|uniref:HAMP domain-containing protein n=1 Tax=Bacillus sp. FJAT-45037 TaxID=2011007 RepID=UPI000C24DC1E|nr:HAMP domain-containing protein [Bacillus sp. FJAT-45037]
MRRKTIMFQLLVKVGLFLTALALILLIIGYSFLTDRIDDEQREQIYTATTIVKHAMESTQHSAETIERMIEEKLYSSAKGITRDLRGNEIEEISAEELSLLANSWDVDEISLWIRVEDDIVIANSSDETQLEMSSRDWGYWFTAFDQLMSLEEVTIEEGQSFDQFWVGPVSRAEKFDHIYYKFAYYFDGTTDFMINAFISDEEIYKQTFESGPTQMIEKILEANTNISEVAVVNVEAWLKGDENDIVEPATDLPILYGSHSIEHEEDETLFLETLQTNQQQSIEFTEAGVPFKKVYLPLAEQRVMTISMNVERQKEIRDQFVSLFIVTCLGSGIILFVLFHFVVRRQLKPLDQIVKHINQVASGDLTTTLILDEQNELDILAEQTNQMTEQLNLLLKELQDKSHSLVIVASLLAKQVYGSVKTMEETSTVMMSESKELLFDSSMMLEHLEKLIDVVDRSNLDEVGNSTDVVSNEEMKMLLIDVKQNVMSLHQVTKDHSFQTTELSFMFYDTLEELNEALTRIDHLALELNEKIRFFKVSDN